MVCFSCFSCFSLSISRWHSIYAPLCMRFVHGNSHIQKLAKVNGSKWAAIVNVLKSDATMYIAFWHQFYRPNIGEIFMSKDFVRNKSNTTHITMANSPDRSTVILRPVYPVQFKRIWNLHNHWTTKTNWIGSGWFACSRHNDVIFNRNDEISLFGGKKMLT